MTLWTSEAAAAATGGKSTAAWRANGVSIDTRTLEPGDLFVALKAARDGHDFVAQALDNGAAAALVTRVPEGVPEDAPLLIVEDVQAALEDLGRAARARTDAQVVAVTGSVGKTSTKEMLRTVLSAQGRVHAAEKSYNNHWGVPLTLARMPEDSEFAVIEIGMNHPGEIAPLSKMARPHVAMVTIVAPAHLAAFESIEGIAREKASIFEGLEPGGVAVINGDLPVTELVASIGDDHAKSLLRFGETSDNSHRIGEVTLKDDCTIVRGTVLDQDVIYKVPAPGKHYAMNAMGVLAVVTALDLDHAMALTSLGQWLPGDGRGARRKIHLDAVDDRLVIELIDDAYNANPASLGAALEVLAAAEPKHDIGRVSRGRRVAYLGDMKELGTGEVELHRSVADLDCVEQIDVIHCVGPLMQHLYLALPEDKRGRWTAEAGDMAADVARDLDAGDVVMAKGSLSMGIGRIVDAIKKMGQTAESGDGGK